jgi:hypothetical protein
MSESAHPRPTQLPVVQPTPATHRASPLAVAAASLGMVAAVVVVLYGMTRTPHEPQTASAPAAETAGAAPAGPSAPPAQANGNTPATTGQGGNAVGANQPTSNTADQNRGQQSQTADKPPASGDSASGTTSGPNVRPTRPPAAPSR